MFDVAPGSAVRSLPYFAAGDRLTPIDPARLATIRLKDEFGHQDLILSATDMPRTSAELDGEP